MQAIDGTEAHSAFVNVWALAAFKSIDQLLTLGVLRTAWGSTAEYAELHQLRDWCGVATYYRHRKQMLELFPTQKGRRRVSLYFKRIPELPGEDPFHVLERVLGPEGLRHWSALLVLFTQHGRRGQIRWLVDDHLEAMGIKKKTRPQRYQAAMFMEVFNDLRIKIETKEGKQIKWDKLPVLLCRTEFGHTRGKRDIVDGYEVQINPNLYQGVRQASGKLGSYWWPQSARAATISHTKYPHAYPLALQLPMRWRWEWRNQKWDHVRLSAGSLFDLAGIDYDSLRPSVAWSRLEKTLSVLNEVGALGDVVTDGPPREWTTVFRLYPPAEQVAKLHGSVEVETFPPDIPLTGREFTRWREGRKLSKTRAARSLGVGRNTITRLENKPDQTIPDKIRHRILNL